MDHFRFPKCFLFLSILITFFSFSGETYTWAEESSLFQQGIKDYINENYEEAIVSLLAAGEEMPASAEAAFYTGLTFKKLLNLPSSKSYLSKALSLKPVMIEAYLPLAEILYSLGETGEAESYLGKAKSAGIKSSRACYLRGLILLDKGEKESAVKEFKRAISLEPRSEAARLSGERLHTMAFNESLLTLTVSYTFQHDDNVILKPSDGISGTEVSDESDTRHVVKGGANYSTSWESLGFKADYNFYQSLHQDLDHMDVQGHTLSLTPYYEMIKSKIYLQGGYGYYLIDNEDYLKTISIQPVWTFLTERGKGIKLFAGASSKDFLNDALSEEEERDGTNVNAGISVLLPYNAGRSYLKIDYMYDSEDTDGDNWDYSGHKGRLHSVQPFTQAMKLSLSGEYYLQEYKNEHAFFLKKREDRILNLGAVLTYNYKGVDFNLHYAYTNSDSNIFIYDYSRNIAGIGIEYTF